ncbi:MAG: DPP IV N-terminal domain-containing protein [Isosphaeraceae bacterium]
MTSWLALGLLANLAIMTEDPSAPRPIDSAAAARQPAPGTVTPASIAYTADGRGVTFLKAEGATAGRALWKLDLAGGEPKVIARAPGPEVLSREEELRRERQRLTATGLAQVVRAPRMDLFVFPINGDLYAQKGDSGELKRLTQSASPELDPQIDPTATRVAFVRDGDLYTLDIASGQETRLTRGAEDGLTHGLAEYIAQEELDRDTGFWWSPDGTRIAFEEADERHIPHYTIVHQGGGKPGIETHRYPFAGQPNAKVRLGVVPASGRGEAEPRWLEFADPGEDVYLARVRWENADSLLVQVLSRDQQKLKLVRIDVSSGHRTTLIEETSATWIDLHDDLRVVHDTGEILWSSERSGYRHLELRDRDGKLIRTLTSGTWPVETYSMSRGTRGVVMLDAARREVWFQSNRGQATGAQLDRVSLDGGPITRVTREPGTQRAIVSADGTSFVDVHSSRNAPPKTTLRDRDGKVIRVIDDASSDPRIAEYRLKPPRLTEFKTRDGVTLYGAYYAPRNIAPGAKVPLVVLVYGGPTVQTVTDSWAITADMTAQFLAERGFAVWKADNRGSSRRGLEFQAPLYRKMGDIEVRDQADGVRFASASFPEIDPARVGVTGRSYGGYMTFMCLEKAPDVFRSGIAQAPVSDWDGYDTGYTERYLGTPENNPDGYKESSTLTLANRIRGDLLIVHGLVDENVHFRHSARMMKSLIEADIPFETLLMPDERHGVRQESNRRYLLDRMAEFFTRTLATRPPATEPE